MKNRTLGFKLVVGGVVAVFIPLLIVGVYSITKAGSALDIQARSRAESTAVRLADMINAILQEEIKLVEQFTTRSDIVTTSTSVAQTGVDFNEAKIIKINTNLMRFIKKYKNEYEVVVVADEAGVVFADSKGGANRGINVTNREYFKVALKGKSSVGGVIKSKATGRPVIPICAPILTHSGKFAGVVLAVMKTGFLADRISTVKIGKTGYPFVADKTGLTIAHPQKEFILKLNLKNIRGMEAIIRRMLKQETGVEGYTFKGIEKISGFAPVAVSGWSVGVTQDRDEYAKAARSIRNATLLIGGVFLFLTIVGILVFTRRLTRPINKIIDGLNQGADQVASAAGEVSLASQTLAQGSAEQAASIEETSASIEEMASMTHQNADHSGQADSLMQQTNSVVEKANTSVKRMRTSMDDITRASEDTQKIIKTIDEIAFQTNLLALNAAVEAARAGEAGAGFAVVADEVRNLALRAAEAAGDTAGLIEETVKKVRDGSVLTATVSEAFSEVSLNSAKVGELIAEIAAASGEQAEGVGQLNTAVSEMDKVTQQNAATAEESAAAAEEMNAQSEQMKQMVSGLVDIIGRRGQAVGGTAPGKEGSRQGLPTPAGRHPASTLDKTASSGAMRPPDKDFSDF